MTRARPQDVKNYTISIAPLAEQKRIVRKLETCEERIGAAREALDEVPKLLEQYRQSVLAAAFRGDLTRDWRKQNPNTEPASKLLTRLRQERRQHWEKSELAKYEAKGKEPPKGWKKRYSEPATVGEKHPVLPNIPPSWTWTSLYSLTEEGNIFDGPFGSKLKTKDYTSEGVRVVRLENLAPLDFVTDKESYVSEEKYLDIQRHEVFEGDIFFSTFIFETLRVCQLPKLDTKAVAKSDCLCVRTMEPIDRPYLAAMLASPTIRRLLADDVHGATRPRINTNQLRSLPILLPPIEEQKEIGKAVKKAWKVIDALSQHHTETSTDLTTLTQSLLAKAFRGDLVPQDPNDEPASVLLERIRTRDDNKKARG